MKKVLYYVIKYGDKYYAPYKNYNKNYMVVSYNLDSILSENKKLAARFGTRQGAEDMRTQEVHYRKYAGISDFNPKLCRVVKVVAK